MFHLAFWLVEFGVCIWSDSYLYCGSVVYCCRWVQKTELIWMAGARQARRRGHTRWLRYPELTSLAHFQSINGLEVKIGRNLWKSSSIRFIYFPCYVTYFMLPSLGMWHRVQMAGVLLIRELDFLLLLRLLLLLLLFLPERGVREGSRGILPVCHLWESLKTWQVLQNFFERVLILICKGYFQGWIYMFSFTLFTFTFKYVDTAVSHNSLWYYDNFDLVNILLLCLKNSRPLETK